DRRRGLISWDSIHETATRVPNVASPNTAFTDSRGRIWVGTVHGSVFVNDRGTWRAYSAADGLSDRTVTGIFEDSEKTLWFGVIGGLSRFDGQRFISTRQRPDFPGNSVQSIIQDAGGDFWLGLNSGIMRTTGMELNAAVADPKHVLRYTLFDS